MAKRGGYREGSAREERMEPKSKERSEARMGMGDAKAGKATPGKRRAWMGGGMSPKGKGC